MEPKSMTVLRTELDALLTRVREVSKPSSAVGRSLRFDEVARDCLRMFEDLATCYKEEFAARDRYKAQSNSWRDEALRLSDALRLAISEKRKEQAENSRLRAELLLAIGEPSLETPTKSENVEVKRS